MKNFTRTLALCLAGLCLLSSCTAGKGAEQTQEQTAVKEKATGVYRRTEVVLPEGYTLPYDTKISYLNGAFHFGAENKNMRTNSSFISDINGMVHEVGAASVGNVEPVQEDHFVHSMWELPGGGCVYVEVGYANNEGNIQSVYLSCRDADGNVVYSIDLPAYLNVAIRADDFYAESQGFYVKDCLFIDGTCLVLTNQGLCAVAENGMKLWSNTSQREHRGIMETDLGVMYLSSTGGLRIVNMADGSLSDEISLPEEVAQGTEYQRFIEVCMGNGYHIYVKNTEGLWGVKFEADEKGTLTGKSTEIINWVNSNITQMDIITLCAADENTILALMRDTFGRALENKLYLLKKVTDVEVQEKEIISLVQVGYNYSLAHAVMLFNEASETHRAVITDYTVYDDKDMRRQKLNAEMAAGRVPDIVFYSDAHNTDTTLQDYISSGLFTDLTPLMQADESFDYDDLLGYVTKPHTSADGAQYLFPLDPSASVYLSSPELLDGVMTPDEMFNMLETLPEGTGLTARDSSFFRDVLSYAVNERIDWKNYTCSFDDGKFGELIDRIKAAITDIPHLPNYEYATDYIGGFMKREYFLYKNYMSGLMSIAEKRYFLMDDLTFTALPNDEKKMISADAPNSYIAITQASGNKEEAFELLETIMIVKRDMAEGGYYFNADIDHAYEKEKNISHVYNEKGKYWSVVEDDKAEQDVTEKLKITKEDAEQLKTVLNSIEDCLHEDNAAYAIASEEIWNGDDSRTGAEIADVIQSRVSIYLAEVSK